MEKVSNILKTKGGTIISVSPDTVVYDAIEIMCDRNVSAIIVLENEKMVGIFTERDYARKLILKGKSSRETPISEVMTKDLITVTPNTSIEDCMRHMASKYVRHLPVMEDDKLVGIISIGDVVRFTIEEQKFIIQNMANYING